MAGLNRRIGWVAIVLPLLVLAMAPSARAAIITVNTLDSGSQPFPLCTLEDAVIAANTQSPVNGCAAGSGFIDTIVFTVTGTIFLENPLVPSSTEELTIRGPLSGGITIDAVSTFPAIEAESSSLELDNLTVAHGASEGGGAVFAGGSDVFISGCTFENNIAGVGGAIFGEESLIFILNSTFVGNSALEAGGAIASEVSALFVSNSTFAGNETSPGNGGAIATAGGESLANNSIFANNLGGNCLGLGDAGFNISDDNSCGFSGTSINNSTTLNLDPLGLQNNGGPTQTIALEPNSQAVNFIPIASCVSLLPGPVLTDQRDFPRPDSGNLGFCDAGAFELQTERITVVPGSEQTQIARPTSSNSDQINTTFTFIDHGSPPLDDGSAPLVLRCDAGNDALNGINVDLFEGTCADLATATGGLLLHLSPFVKHTISGHSYGTIFQSDPPDMLQQMSETVLARIVTQEPPWEETCGEWTIHIEVAGLDTATLGLGGSNPFALVVEDGDKNEGCFDIDNAVVGGQITPPHKVRRGARRGRR